MFKPNLKCHRMSGFFIFSISALPPEGGFQMSIHLLHLRPLGQKIYVQILERGPSYKIISQNVTGGSDFQWFLHHNYLVSLMWKHILKKNGALANRLFRPYVCFKEISWFGNCFEWCFASSVQGNCWCVSWLCNGLTQSGSIFTLDSIESPPIDPGLSRAIQTQQHVKLDTIHIPLKARIIPSKR